LQIQHSSLIKTVNKEGKLLTMKVNHFQNWLSQ